MDKNVRRKHTAEFKTQVVLELLKETKTVGEIGSQFGIHPTLIGKWRSLAQEELKTVFTEKSSKELAERDKLIDELYKQIGQLKVEADWLKKKMGLTH